MTFWGIKRIYKASWFFALCFEGGSSSLPAAKLICLLSMNLLKHKDFPFRSDKNIICSWKREECEQMLRFMVLLKTCSINRITPKTGQYFDTTVA